MGDSGVVARLGNMKALLGIVAGAGASYGLYKLISREGKRRNKKKATLTLFLLSGIYLYCTIFDDCTQPLVWSDICAYNVSALLIHQNLIREFDGIHIISAFLSDPATEVKIQTLNALNNLCMNIQNQEQIKIFVPRVLELIEMSPVNSELQLGALRLLTNLSVTDKHQHLLKGAVTLLLSLLVVSNETLQVQTLKVLVNLSSNPDMIDDIVQAPASVMLLFDKRTAPAVLLRLLTFVGNLKAWRPSAQVAEELRRKQDGLFRVMLDESSQLHGRLLQLLSHPDAEIQAQVARVMT
uniref:Armadillo repeat containing 10 n=1 Tax=Oryzias melastigma TaxID=30732 RepID=A0A3B3BSF6_ORYME